MKRISGVIGFVSTLANEMSRHVDVEVITTGAATGSTETPGVSVHRVEPKGFPLRAAARLRQTRPDSVLIVSGVSAPSLVGPYWAPCIWACPKTKLSFLQATTLKGPASFITRKGLARFCDRVYAASKGIKENIGSGGNDVELLLPAVDLSSHPFTSRDGTIAKVGFINHANWVKGADLAAAAMVALHHRYPSLTFCIAGEGELSAEIRELTRNLPIEHFGYLDQGPLTKLISGCDALLLPFRTSATVLGISQTVLECMALGTIVIGSDNTAITDAIDDHETGLIASSVDEMVHAVETLMGDPGLASTITKRARAVVEERFDISRTASDLAESLAL